MPKKDTTQAALSALGTGDLLDLLIGQARHVSEEPDGKDRLIAAFRVLAKLGGKGGIVERRRSLLLWIDRVVKDDSDVGGKVHSLYCIGVGHQPDSQVPGFDFSGQWSEQTRKLAAEVILVWGRKNQSKWTEVNAFLACFGLATANPDELKHEWQQVRRRS